MQNITNGIHSIVECRTNTKLKYSGVAYISFYQDDTDTSLFNDELITFNKDGLININQDMDALFNIHVVGSPGPNTDKRLWMQLVDYDTRKNYAQYIVCDTAFATGTIHIAIPNLKAGTRLAVYLYEAFNVNTGLSGSWIQVVKL